MIPATYLLVIECHCVITYFIFVAGAMRLPNLCTDKDKTHYLTDFYANEFNLHLGPFNNYDENALLKFYDKKTIKVSGMYIFDSIIIATVHTSYNLNVTRVC